MLGTPERGKQRKISRKDAKAWRGVAATKTENLTQRRKDAKEGQDWKIFQEMNDLSRWHCKEKTDRRVFEES